MENITLRTTNLYFILLTGYEKELLINLIMKNIMHNRETTRETMHRNSTSAQWKLSESDSCNSNTIQTPMEFVKTYSPLVMEKICTDRYECFAGDYPTLKKVDNHFGEGTAVSWLAVMIDSIISFANVPGIASQQVIDLANGIFVEYENMKITELAYFVHLFKMGYYEKFYGAASPLAITRSLRSFVAKERKRITNQICREQMRRKREKRHTKDKYITREEYNKIRDLLIAHHYDPYKVLCEMRLSDEEVLKLISD